MDNRIKELLEYFQECMVDADNVEGGLIGQARANYPMAIVCLGDKTAENLGQEMRQQVLSIWPAYKNALLFLSAEPVGEDVVYRVPGREEQLSPGQIQEKVSELFEESSYYRNYTRLLVFYILDTTGIAEDVDLNQYIKLCGKVSDVLAFANQNKVFCMTLDEKIGQEANAARLRNQLADILAEGSEAREQVPCTYVVSNKNTMGSLMPKNNYFGRIFADLLILANGAESYVASNVIHSGVKTVAFATVQKPSSDIAKASVSGLLKRMSQLRNVRKVDTEQLEQEGIQDLRERLGISKEGRFFMLDPYIEEAEKHFPSAEVIDAFPRKTSDDLDLYTLNAKEVDEQTFGTWSCYVQGIVSGIEKDIVDGFRRENNFKENYLEYLKDKFSRGELIWLSKNTEQIDELLEQNNTAVGGKNVIESLKEELSVKVFHNEVIRETMREVIVMAGNHAREFMKMWNNLVSEEAVVVKQMDVVPVYEQKVQHYIDMNGERISEDFQDINSVDELLSFLRKEIKALVRSDKIFRASFEDEMIMRLGQKDPAVALRSISEQLSGKNVKVWLSSSGAALDAPVQLTMLLKTGTELEQTISSSLDGSYYTYDTCIGETADALNIYMLNDIQLRL